MPRGWKGRSGAGELFLLFNCLGCDLPHSVRVLGPEPVWQFNGDWERPTLAPSIRARWTHGPENSPRVCHSFVKDGRIQYLADCTHALAGQTVDLPEVS